MEESKMDFLTPPSSSSTAFETTSCHIFGCNPICAPDNLCCPLSCSPTCPHSNSIFKKPSIIIPQGYRPATQRSVLKRSFVEEHDDPEQPPATRYGRHSQLPQLKEDLDTMPIINRSLSVPMMELTPSQTNASRFTQDTIDQTTVTNDQYGSGSQDSMNECSPSPTDSFRSRNLSGLFYNAGTKANSSTAGIKRRRLTSAFGGTEKVYLNGPVYELQKGCQDCWRAIKGIDMELEDLEYRYIKQNEAGKMTAYDEDRIEMEFNRLTNVRCGLEEEYAELTRIFEAEKEALNKEFSFRAKVKKSAKNVWRMVGGKKH